MIIKLEKKKTWNKSKIRPLLDQKEHKQKDWTEIEQKRK